MSLLEQITLAGRIWENHIYYFFFEQQRGEIVDQTSYSEWLQAAKKTCGSIFKGRLEGKSRHLSPEAVISWNIEVVRERVGTNAWVQ